MTETAMGGPTTPRTCAEALWPQESDPDHTLEFTMGNAPAPIAEALRAILPANAQRVTVAITWDGDAPQTIF